jgi:hypothetical protein
MKTMGRGPNREDGWIWIWMFPKLVIIQVPIHLKFNLEWRKIKSVQKAMNWRGGEGEPILQIPIECGTSG